MLHQLKRVIYDRPREDPTPYPDVVKEELRSGKLDGKLQGHAHTKAFLRTWAGRRVEKARRALARRSDAASRRFAALLAARSRTAAERAGLPPAAL